MTNVQQLVHSPVKQLKSYFKATKSKHLDSNTTATGPQTATITSQHFLKHVCGGCSYSHKQWEYLLNISATVETYT